MRPKRARVLAQEEINMGFEKLTAYLDSLEERYGVPGADLQITRGYETIYRHRVGWSDYEKTRPVSPEDVYDIYSGSKPVTMVGIMQLVERGLLSLDDRLDRYLPEFGQMKYATDYEIGGFPFHWPTAASPLAEAKRPMLIHDLMSMTAGLSYDLNAAPIRRVLAQDPAAGTRALVAAMAEMPLLYEPGTRYTYSLGHDVLAAVAEVVTGQRFADYIRENVFEPLGIKRMYSHVPEQEKPHLAAQYAQDPATGAIRPDRSMVFRLSPNYDSGGAGLCVSVEEYGKLTAALANGGMGATGRRILRPESIDELRRNRLDGQQLRDFRLDGHEGYGYGLGVRTLIDPETSKSPLGEFGWDGAAGCYILVDPKNRIGLFYAQEVLGMLAAYREIHPAIRDLSYEALGL